MTAMNMKEWSIVCTVQTWADVIRKLDKANKAIPICLVVDIFRDSRHHPLTLTIALGVKTCCSSFLDVQ